MPEAFGTLKMLCVCGTGGGKEKALTLPDVIISGGTEVLRKIRKKNYFTLLKADEIIPRVCPN